MSKMMVIELDEAQMKRLSKDLDPRQWREFVVRGVTDLYHTAEAEIKDRTPAADQLTWPGSVRTGNLYRSLRSDTGRLRDANPQAFIGTDCEYAWWIELGKTRTGRKMKVRPGGYRMFEQGTAEAEKAVPRIVNKVIAEIEQDWRK